LNLDIKDFFHAISTKKVVSALQLEPFGFTYEMAVQFAKEQGGLKFLDVDWCTPMF
jgi:hypothetical protein